MHHSIGLGLKAFLRSRGATLGALENLGHDLKSLHREAMRMHLSWLWPEAGTCKGIIHCLADANTGHAFRYIVNGHNSVPQWFLVQGAAYGLTAATYKHCLRRTFGRTQGKQLEQTHAGLRKSQLTHESAELLRKSREKG